MSEDIFTNDNSRKLNKKEVLEIFHSIQDDMGSLVMENLNVVYLFVTNKEMKLLIKMADSVQKSLKDAEEFYSFMDDRDFITTDALIRFLRSMEHDIGKNIKLFEDFTLLNGGSGDAITAHGFFSIFLKIVVLLKVSILMESSLEEMIDEEIISQEHERMKREGLI
jgi:hypothetical protein